jgi:hydroxymethylpyrimidine pyrophosphatase-like HAD family hydrolase
LIIILTGAELNYLYYSRTTKESMEMTEEKNISTTLPEAHPSPAETANQINNQISEIRRYVGTSIRAFCFLHLMTAIVVEMMHSEMELTEKNCQKEQNVKQMNQKIGLIEVNVVCFQLDGANDI